MLTLKLQRLFSAIPEALYGFTDISYSSFSKEYRSALVFAMPYGEQLTLEQYTEERFENGICNARKNWKIRCEKLRAY